jgi:hypothetical protein
VSEGPGVLLALVGGAAGGLVALAAREAVLASPAVAGWLRHALEPLRRAGNEGYAPSAIERRRLAVLGAATALVGGWFLAGALVALPLAVAGPALAAWAISKRRRRYRARWRPRFRASPRRSPTRWRPGARCAPRSPRSRRPSTGRPPSSWPASGRSSIWARRRATPSKHGAGECTRRGSTPSPPRCSARGWPEATSPACCGALRRARPSGIGRRRMRGRPPPRRALRAFWWWRCRAAEPCSPS